MPVKDKVTRYKWTEYRGSRTQGTPKSESSTDFSHDFPYTVTTGPNIPDWRSRIRNHQDATTHLDAINYIKVDLETGSTRIDRIPIKDIPGADEHYYEVNRPWTYSESRSLFVGIPSPVFPSGNLNVQTNSEALGKFIEKARSVQTQFEGGVFMGQLRQTVQQIVSPAKALRQGISDYLSTLKRAKGNPYRFARVRGGRNRGTPQTRRAETLRKIAADTWLEYAYGWRPLTQDISGAIVNLTQQQQPSDVNIVSSRALNQQEIGRYPNAVSSDGSLFTWDLVYEEVAEAIFRGAVWINTDSNPSLLYGNETLRGVGLTIDNFLPTVWELIPYSFLVDYFANIGEIISAASFPEGKFAWKMQGYKTVVRQRVENIVRTPIVSSNSQYNILTSGSLGSLELEYGYLGRLRYEGSLVPDFRLSIPSIGSTRWINMAGLAAQHKSLIPFT